MHDFFGSALFCAGAANRDSSYAQTDLPMTFVCPLVETTIAHRRVRGLSSPYRTEPVQHMEDLWLEDQR